MNEHIIKINGISYGNVGTITSDFSQSDKYYDITTLDGIRHVKYRYKKINYTVQFYNLLDGVYTNLKELILGSSDTAITCGFPDDSDGFVYNDYYLSITGEINKGYLRGEYFKNGLTVLFEAVRPLE